MRDSVLMLSFGGSGCIIYARANTILTEFVFKEGAHRCKIE